MKKFFSLIAILAIMATCIVACNKDTEEDLPTPIITTEAEEKAIEVPMLSDTFIKTALQFIDEYSSPSKKLENLAFELIQQSGNYRDDFYSYLNDYLFRDYGEELHQSFGYNRDSVDTVKVFIHNYKSGGYEGCASFNGQEPTFNYNHDKFILAAGVLGKKYPDNISLAEARIVAFVLTQMSQEDVGCCILTDDEGLKSYDFTFENLGFKELSVEILQAFCEN